MIGKDEAMKVLLNSLQLSYMLVTTSIPSKDCTVHTF